MNFFKKRIIEKYPWLARFLRIRYGLILDEKSDKDYVMGANDINWKVLKPDGDWTSEAEAIVKEKQHGRFDTMGCVGYSLMNVIEMLALNKWDKKWNLSDRYINRMSNTTRNGNSMRTVLDTVRKYGVVNEKDWGWDRATFNWNTYYKTVDKQIINKGEAWIKEHLFGYDSVWVTPQALKEALKYSPLYVAGYAWYRKGMLYYSVGSPNHCFTVVKYNQAIAYDSYEPYIKHLDDSYKLYYVKRIYLEKKTPDYDKKEIKKLLDRGFKYIMRTDKVAGGKGEVYKLENGKLVELGDQDKKDLMILTLANKDDLTGISEKDYFNLLD